MIHHYLLIAARNLAKYKVQSLVSIVGLMIGLVSFTYGCYWLRYETSFDGFYPDSKQIYLVSGLDKQTGKKMERMPLILARKLKQEFPEIKETTQIYSNFSSSYFNGVTYIGHPIEQFVDELYFRFFPPKVICGRNDNILRASDEIVITRSFAKKYWKTPEEALGKVLKNGYREVLNIVAVVEDPPKNSLFQVEIYELDTSDRKMEKRAPETNQWKLMSSRIYLLIDKKADIQAFENKITDYLIENKYNDFVTLNLVPLTDIRHTFGSELSFNITYIRIFSITTLLLLLCVFFNFVNLLLNRTYQRGKEMRLRDALGAGKRSLLSQLLIELSLQLIIAITLAYCLLEISRATFGKLFETEIVQSDLSNQFFLIALSSWCFLIAIILPILLHFIRRSSLLLSGGIQANQKPLFRKVSMVLQIGICVFFLMCTGIIGHQISFMRQKDLGFNREGLIMTTMTSRNRSDITQDMSKLSTIQSFTSGGIFSITHDAQLTNEVKWEGKADDFNPGFQFLNVGEDFLTTLQIPLKEGRFLTPDDEGNSVVVNEEAVRVMGLEHPIGSTVSIWMYVTDHNGNHVMGDLKVVGIIKNFQSASLRNPIYPQIIQYDRSKWNSYTYYMRVTPGTEATTIDHIHKLYKKHFTTGDPECNASTMNDIFEKLSRSENASLQLFSILALLCTLISLFGIYSISSGNMEKRRKEIAVRKVMGASTPTIIRMFFREYLLITVIANLVSLPLAWLFMQRWLEQYPYQAGIQAWMYGCIFIGTTLLILLSVLWQTLRAAETNPAEVIKSE